MKFNTETLKIVGCSIYVVLSLSCLNLLHMEDWIISIVQWIKLARSRFRTGQASAHLEKRYTMVMMKILPFVHLGWCPVISRHTLSNGASTNIICKGPCFGALFQRVVWALATSLTILQSITYQSFPYAFLLICYFFLSVHRWPFVIPPWVNFNKCPRNLAGINIWSPKGTLSVSAYVLYSNPYFICRSPPSYERKNGRLQNKLSLLSTGIVRCCFVSIHNWCRCRSHSFGPSLNFKNFSHLLVPCCFSIYKLPEKGLFQWSGCQAVPCFHLSHAHLRRTSYPRCGTEILDIGSTIASPRWCIVYEPRKCCLQNLVYHTVYKVFWTWYLYFRVECGAYE